MKNYYLSNELKRREIDIAGERLLLEQDKHATTKKKQKLNVIIWAFVLTFNAVCIALLGVMFISLFYRLF